jgi:hypothetical protein
MKGTNPMIESSKNTLTTIQQMYFDVTDLINGETYKAIGYDGQKDFLKEMQKRLSDLEFNLTHE